MSTQSIITLDNLPTDVALGQYMAQAGVDVLKTLRFEIGCIDHDKLREMMRLERLACGCFCYIDEDDTQQIREAVIRNTINKIFEL